MQITEKDKKI